MGSKVNQALAVAGLCCVCIVLSAFSIDMGAKLYSEGVNPAQREAIMWAMWVFKGSMLIMIAVLVFVGGKVILDVFKKVHTLTERKARGEKITSAKNAAAAQRRKHNSGRRRAVDTQSQTEKGSF